MVQGIIAEAGGGDFSSGFAAGFIGSLSGEVTDGIGGDGGGAIVARTTVASMFGGMAAKATGGSFEDGAFQAAMVHLFNKEAARAVRNAQQGQLTHDYEFETEICSRSGSACTANNVWGVVKDNSVPWQDGRLTDGTVSKIPGIGTVTTRVDDSSYTLVNQTHDDHLFKHGTVTRSLVVSETTISVRTVGTGYNTNRFTQGANYFASPYFKGLDTNIKATIGVQQFRNNVKSFVTTQRRNQV